MGKISTRPGPKCIYWASDCELPSHSSARAPSCAPALPSGRLDMSRSLAPAGPAARALAASTARPRRASPRAASSPRAPSPRRPRASRRRVAASRRHPLALAASASDATKFDAILAELGERRGSAEELRAAVEEVREELTTGFYEHAADRVAELRARGDAPAAAALDELCGRVMAAADRTFGEIVADRALGDGSEAPVETTASEEASDAIASALERLSSSAAELTPEQSLEIQRRWDAVAEGLARRGETDAFEQARKNATSRRDSTVQLLGRHPAGPRELRALHAVTAERRIIDVLLEIPVADGAREEALTDAFTPPPGYDDASGEGEGKSTHRGGGAQMTLEDDETLVGEEEEVFTTPARLLAAVELAVKQAEENGDERGDARALRELRDQVAARCDFLQ